MSTGLETVSELVSKDTLMRVEHYLRNCLPDVADVGFLPGVDPPPVHDEPVGARESLSAGVADVWLLEGVLGATVVHQLLPRDEGLAAVLALQGGDSMDKI